MSSRAGLVGRDFGQIPEMLGRVIARELQFDRSLIIREAIAQAVREELEMGRTEVEARAAIMGQWRRWQAIADLRPDIGTAQFFRASRNALPMLEEAAERKRAAMERKRAGTLVSLPPHKVESEPPRPVPEYRRQESHVPEKKRPERAQPVRQAARISPPCFRLPDDSRFDDPELDALFQRYVKTPAREREALFNFDEISRLAEAESAYNQRMQEEWLNARKAGRV